MRDQYIKSLVDAVTQLNERILALEQAYMEDKLLGKQPEDSGKIEE